ncbi:MAG TPA: hypothetical protein VLA56_01215 [Pseudomonadales bacterium]|nr:hypothetical protein [Pseudomonadales bacterium]
MSRTLAHPVVRRLICTCRMADEMLLWEWLVDQLDPAKFHVQETSLVEDAHARETELLFTSELDAHRFELWALDRGFLLDDLPLT